MDMTELIKRLRLGASISRDRGLNLDFAEISDEAANAIERLSAALSPPAEEGATPRVDALREGIRHRNILRGFNMPEDHHDALELAADFEAATNTLRARVLELERELSQSWNAAIESALELVLRSKQNMICRTVTVIGDKNYEAERCVAVTKTKADEEFRLLHQAIRALLR